MIAVDRLQAISHGVDALGDRLIPIIVAFGREFQDAEQLTIGQEWELDRSLRTGWLLGAWGRLPKPDFPRRLSLTILNPNALGGQGGL